MDHGTRSCLSVHWPFDYPAPATDADWEMPAESEQPNDYFCCAGLAGVGWVFAGAVL